MRAEQPASDNRDFAAGVLLWLHLLILTVGALQFAFVPESVLQPLLAVVALAVLTLSILVTRSIPRNSAAISSGASRSARCWFQA